MPSYEFTGPGPHVYPDTRDASGCHLGAVEPGDIRILDDPPDGMWTPEIPARGDGREEPAGSAPPAAPPVTPGQPAPPAVLPQLPSASNNTQEG
jgi:hypothetical protein